MLLKVGETSGVAAVGRSAESWETGQLQVLNRWTPRSWSPDQLQELSENLILDSLAMNVKKNPDGRPPG